MADSSSSSSSSNSSSLSSSSSGPGSNSSDSSSSPGRSVLLRRSAQVPYSGKRFHGFRFQVEAYAAHLMDNEVFLFLRGTVNPETGELTDRLSNVCSAPDMAEYPVSGPVGQPPFYRRSSLDLIFRTQAEAEEAWTAIKTEVKSLVDSLNRMDALTSVDEVEVS